MLRIQNTDSDMLMLCYEQYKYVKLSLLKWDWSTQIL